MRGEYIGEVIESQPEEADRTNAGEGNSESTADSGNSTDQNSEIPLGGDSDGNEEGNNGDGNLFLGGGELDGGSEGIEVITDNSIDTETSGDSDSSDTGLPGLSKFSNN